MSDVTGILKISYVSRRPDAFSFEVLSCSTQRILASLIAIRQLDANRDGALGIVHRRLDAMRELQ